MFRIMELASVKDLRWDYASCSKNSQEICVTREEWARWRKGRAHLLALIPFQAGNCPKMQLSFTPPTLSLTQLYCYLF